MACEYSFDGGKTFISKEEFIEQLAKGKLDEFISQGIVDLGKIKSIAPKKTASQDAKNLADKIRGLKIDLSKLSDGGLQSNPLGLPIAVWNSAMDIVAKVVEEGGNIADAIKRGLNYIQKNHRGQWNKKEFNDEVLKELGLRGITVNGQDLLVKDDSETVREFAETVNGFYSDIEQSILDVRKSNVTAKEWLGVIGSGDEAKFTGVRQWLESMPPNKVVSKSEIQQWMKDNRIEIVEVVRGDGGFKMTQERLDEFNQLLQDEDILGFDRISQARAAIRDSKDWAKNFDVEGNERLVELGNEYHKENESYKNNETKFSQYQLEGEKENYKEVLVTMPVAKSKQEYIVEQDYRTPNTFYAVNQKTGVKLKFGSYDSAKSQAERLSKEAQPDFDKQFKSSHFDEPNILVHLRMNTRKDAEGNKVLFLEEVQGDYPQEYRKQQNLIENYVDKNSAKVIEAFKKKGVLEVICP